MEERLNNLASEVFRIFARFEYALKAAGFHTGNGDAKPDWQKFAQSLSQTFENPSDAEFRTAVKYILEHPPKKQVIDGGNLSWSDAPPATNLQSDRVLTYVRRVRNNLFHGGKFNGRWFEPERSELLLKHSLTILIVCLQNSDEVRMAFDSE
ncbi:hypothetical protein GCM10007972_13190 [Iodidimonas muriae]|uniref:Apea-like HEPN domain-containing protein n=1 Tax=Iodidimonas muriae TaxID=261467 RepID=A0ABQ2LCC2_9PROT|nr:hypothetical protein [Iodidimonas muriae]GER06673.1 hypothetical protein JCM17843_09830 [Kordiimonadales bacterium JCM 17843]GGO10411.1 hypothetical protein GCM10007972_13190 [Iodidimonas muriae]